MNATQTEPPLVTVHLEGLPLRVLREVQEHVDGLLREFALVASDATSTTVPRRLVDLASTLAQQYSVYTTESRRAIEDAAARGVETMDVSYTVPESAALAAEHLLMLLDEADEYCRSGDLLTMATPPHLAAFRRWYLGEFIRQINGQAPRRWSEDR